MLSTKERTAKTIEALEAQLKILEVQYVLNTDKILKQIADLEKRILEEKDKEA
jgi:hypothetical protein